MSVKKYIRYALPLLFLTITLLPSCNTPPYYENAKKVFPAVVRVIVGDSMGSGVIISDKGYVLTGQHVVRDSKKALVLLNNGSEYEGKVAAADQQRDLAIIKLPDYAGNLPFSSLGDSSESDELQIASPVLVLGYPGENQMNNLMLTTGYLCAFRRIESVDFLQSDARVSPGSSGGPMINSNGEVIGIINSKYVGLEDRCATFATASSEARVMMDDLLNPPKPPPAAGGNTGPVINNIRSENVTSNSAAVIWETSVPSISGVEFGRASSARFYPSADGKPGTRHSVQIMGLAPREIYRYRIIANDNAGHETVSADLTLTTTRVACPNVGCRAPDFNLATADGKSMSLNSLKNRKAILVFTTTGCSSCAEVMRCIGQIYDNWPRQQMEVVVIVAEEKPADVQRWIKLYNVKWPVAIDPDRSITNAYQPAKLPALYFLNDEGDIKIKKYAPLGGCGKEIDAMLRLY
jgi:peroxiredoxin